MKGPKALLESENNLVTDMGAWFPGERVVFRGKDLHHDLGDMSWMELYLFGITGRTFSPNQIKVFNTIWVLTSYPDPRLWNNRVVALAASARSTGVLGMSAGIAVSEASIYGARPEIKSHNLLLRIHRDMSQGEGLEQLVITELKSARVLPGFGRPVTRRDERLAPFMDVLRLLDAHNGKHLALATRIEDILVKKRYPQRLNYAGATAAVAADMGLNEQEYYLFGVLGFVGGMIPALVAAKTKGEGEFFPIRCADVKSVMKITRKWND